MNDHASVDARPDRGGGGEAAVLDFPGPAARPSMAKPQLSVVICTLDEAEAIGGVLAETSAALAGIRHELIVVDDSPDDRTAEAVLAVQASLPGIRLVRRRDGRGLSSAVIAGWDAAEGAVLAAMDGDGQHDPLVLRRLLAALERERADLAIGSRYLDGDSGLSGFRARLSEFGTALTSLILGLRIADPLSGLFLVRREWFEAVRPRLSGVGFKILVDTIASGRRRPVAVQVPTALRPRAGGRSKLDLRVAAELCALLVEKRTGGILRAQFLLFAGVGLSGGVVNLGALSLARALGAGSFGWSEAGAIALAMVWNFWLNNALTFRDRRLRGAALWQGLILFCLGSTAGAAAGEAAALAAFRAQAGWLSAGLVSVATGGVLNYLAASRLSWRGRPRASEDLPPTQEEASASAA